MRTDTRRTDTAARRACIGWGSCSPAVPCVHARESALARRSRRQVRHPRRSATCGPLARRPGRIACRSRGTWVRGETQRTAPMPTAEGGRRWEGSNGAHIVKPSKKTRSGKRVVRRAADPEHQLRSRDSIDAPLSEAATGELSVRRRSGQGVAVHGAGRSARRACGGVDLLEKPARYVGSASWTRERPLEGVAHGRRACSTRNLTLPKPARGATTSEHIPQSTLIMGNNCAQSEHTDDRG